MIEPGGVADTDEYDIDARLGERGHVHRSACHADGELARDDDGDGSCEVPVNTREGSWSLPRSWPRRDISQEEMPLYLGVFEFVDNARRRGETLLGSLIELLVRPSPRNAG